MKTIKHIKQNIKSNETDMHKHKKLTYKEYHDRDVEYRTHLQALKDVLKLIDEWEKENKVVLSTKTNIADYVKWNKIKKLKQKIQG